MPEGSRKWRASATPNRSLGTDPHNALLETADNWNSGDTLVLHSLGVAPAKGEEAGAWMGEYVLLSAQHQAEKILQRMTVQRASLPKRASAVLSIQRIF